MKRITCHILALLMILALPLVLPLNTYATSTTITVEVPEPSYELQITPDFDLGYKAKGADIGLPTITNASGFQEGSGLKVSISHTGAFTCPEASTTIPFTFSLPSSEEFDAGTFPEWNSGDYLYFYYVEGGSVSNEGCKITGEKPMTMWLTIADGAWDTLLPGKYATTITYDVAYIYP